MSQPIRTPTEHRAAVAAWAATAPANDHVVFGRRAHTTNPKHAALSEELEGLRHWREFRSSDAGWLAPQPANDNTPEALGADAKIVARPSADFLATAADGDDIERDDKGRVIRRGRVLISNGERYEPAIAYDERGRLATVMMRIPAGAVIGYLAEDLDPADPDNVGRWFTPTERAERASGAKAKREETERRNDHFKWYAGADKPGAAALPREPKHLWELFVGGQNRNRPRGHDHADDEPHVRDERERHVQMMMTPLEIDILDAALSARGFADIGRLVGCNNDKAAERAGRRALIEAAKKFEEIRHTMP
ncbi:hypothetical protein ACFSX7_02385 [Camelimonas lactis]